MGDYNKLMFASEKDGGNAKLEGQMKQFRDSINRCNLRDMGYNGSAFTWHRRLGNRGWVQERLDCALVSTNWVGIFPRTKLLHIASSTSDHSILLLKATNSRNNWLKVGDKNTTFCHSKGSNRLQRNTISRLLDSNNVWIEDEEQIGRVFM